MPEEIVSRILRLPGYRIYGWETSHQHADSLDPADGRGALLRVRRLWRWLPKQSARRRPASESSTSQASARGRSSRHQ